MLCPECGGAASFLGELGVLDHFRCIQCGWEFSHRNEPDDDDAWSGGFAADH